MLFVMMAFPALPKNALMVNVLSLDITIIYVMTVSDAQTIFVLLQQATRMKLVADTTIWIPAVMMELLALMIFAHHQNSQARMAVCSLIMMKNAMTTMSVLQAIVVLKKKAA
jgi:hypothetical protein